MSADYHLFRKMIEEIKLEAGLESCVENAAAHIKKASESAALEHDKKVAELTSEIEKRDAAIERLQCAVENQMELIRDLTAHLSQVERDAAKEVDAHAKETSQLKKKLAKTTAASETVWHLEITYPNQAGKQDLWFSNEEHMQRHMKKLVKAEKLLFGVKKGMSIRTWSHALMKDAKNNEEKDDDDEDDDDDDDSSSESSESSSSSSSSESSDSE
jgi:hypothetical protein